jgi:phosphoribosyl-ATP pyrophosphohydrolase
MAGDARETLGSVIARLEEVIDGRRGAADSWSARLIADRGLAARKLIEEAAETAFATLENDKAAIAAEAADLVYHLLALLAAAGVTTAEVAAVLAAREGRSGLEEKASRTPPRNKGR